MAFTIIGIFLLFMGGYVLQDLVFRGKGLRPVLAFAAPITLGHVAIEAGNTAIAVNWEAPLAFQRLIFQLLVLYAGIGWRMTIFPIWKDYRRLAVRLTVREMKKRGEDPSKLHLAGLFEDHCREQRINYGEDEEYVCWDDVASFLVLGPAKMATAPALRAVVNNRYREKKLGATILDIFKRLFAKKKPRPAQ